jgi:hypothetical protein
MSTPLSALSSILSSGITTIESTYAKHGTTFPSIDEPFRPAPFEDDEALCQTIDLVIAAAAQLIALVKPPPRTVAESGLLVGVHVYIDRHIFLIDGHRTSFTSQRAFR